MFVAEVLSAKEGMRKMKYSFKDEETQLALSYSAFLTHLTQGGGHFLTEIIRQYSSPIFWECVPVNQNNVDTLPFEFVLLEAPEFSSLQADGSSFADHFDLNKRVVTFENLGRDALLVAPCPSDKIHSKWMINLQSFVARAPDDLIEEFWEQIGEGMNRRLSETTDPIWLSTSGLGVYWLHARIDSTPKYYHWRPYR
jgi:hypothetical protein